MQITDIQKSHLEKYQKEYLSTIHPATAKRKLSSLKSFFDWASITPTPQIIIPQKAKNWDFLYVSLAILPVMLGFGIYLRFSTNKPEKQVYVPQPIIEKTRESSRYLPFNGVVYDKEGNPITQPVRVEFFLYNLPSDGSLVWSSQKCMVGPEEDGGFSIILGSKSGKNFECLESKEIPGNAFYENSGLWLSLRVEDDNETDPRIPISTVANAESAQTLSGFAPRLEATEGSIPVINSEGDLVIATSYPHLKSTSAGGSFVIEGAGGVVIQSLDTSNSSISINPDGSGSLNLFFEGSSPSSNGFVNAVNANIASGSLYYGEAANDSKDYSLIDLRSGSNPSSKFKIDAQGNTYLAGGISLPNIGASSGVGIVVDEKGNFFKESSSIRYKKDITDFSADFGKILSLSAKKYKYINNNQEDIGYLAENLDDLGLKDLVIYDELGRPEAVKYSRIPLYLIPILSKQQEKLENLFSLIKENISEGTVYITKPIIVNRISTSVISPIEEGGSVKIEGKLTAQEIYTEKLQVGDLDIAKQDQRVAKIEEYLKSFEEDKNILKTLTEKTLTDNTEGRDESSDRDVITQNLFVTGSAAVISLSLSQSLLIGQDMTLAENSINTVFSPLEIQSLGASPIKIMAGLITIDTQGNVEIAGNLNVTGSIKAAILEVGKIVAAPQESSTTTNSIAGQATIAAGSEETKVENSNVNLNTLIYVSPASNTFNRVLYVKSKGEDYFIVGLTPIAETDIKFDWIIVDAPIDNQ